MKSQLELLPDNDLAALNPIRVETALSRFPVHRLAKKGIIDINLQTVKWEVTHNSKYGQPGPLAYKLDTLIVNRRIDAAERPLPKIIKLGSLHEIAQELGLSRDTNLVKKTLHQNASAYIEFGIRYKRRDGTERDLKHADNRYGLVLTGEKMPSGEVADAVYIVLHDWYRELLDDVVFRPLDYDYLKELSPGAQRFYELLSFQIFGAIANKRQRAKLLYSDYCMRAPQTQYNEWDKVRKQMYKVHVVHLETKYIKNVTFEEITNREGKPDWEMLYTPGPRAFAEYRAFTRRKTAASVANHARKASTAIQQSLPSSESSPSLLRELTERGISEKKARLLLAASKPFEQVLEALHRIDKIVAKDTTSRIRNPAGLYIQAIEDASSTPASTATRPDSREEYEEYCCIEIERFIAEVLPTEEYAQIVERLRQDNQDLCSSMDPAQVELLMASAVRNEIRSSGAVHLLSMEQFRSRVFA